jgi:uncharacterized protein (TIGR02145 family)
MQALVSAPSGGSGGFSGDWWTNSTGTLFSNVVDHLVYGVVTAEDGKVWLDRNLGASQVATSFTDSAACGYLYQWGRLSDGHQLTTSSTTGTQSTGDVPGNANFIIGYADWRATENTLLWQGGTNNPAPPGFHVPTQTEWATWVAASSVVNSAGAYSSTLKLTGLGRRSNMDGDLGYSGGGWGFYWTSTWHYQFSASIRVVFMTGSVSQGDMDARANGEQVRCIKD